MAFKNIKNDYNRGNSFLSYFVSGKNKQYHSQQFSDAALIPITATGGNIITFGDYTIHSFPGGSLGASNPYSFALSPNPLLPTTNFDIILVAGGGSGGDGQPGLYGGGGAGAGGVRFIPQISLTAGTYPISVGGGGANSPAAPAAGANGQPTVFNSPNGNSIPAITSDGGGYGGAGGAGIGNPGGSGGGKDYPGTTTQFGAGNSNLGNTPEPRASGPTSPIGDTKYQGSPGNGSSADNPSGYGGGGGGGARYSPSTYYQSPITGPGITTPSPGSPRGQGGDGIDFSPIIGPYATNGFGDSNIPSQAWFGGGGIGGKYPSGVAPGAGGKGGGGYSPVNAQSNTGGGGGSPTGNGGPGIVFIRYKTYGGPTGS